MIRIDFLQWKTIIQSSIIRHYAICKRIHVFILCAGAVLENTGYLKWIDKYQEIEWCLYNTNFELSTIEIWANDGQTRGSAPTRKPRLL